ncbi:hypothetical protein ABIB57_002974 [Devosia sp. UYZn731]|uniref:hypothetical protein n=1 Tax=Devosia sp. UYZn731 TaxID=3156345 RepID=UPI003396DE77
MMLNRYQNLVLGQNRTMPEVVERAVDFDDIENFTIEQLLTSDLFQLYPPRLGFMNCGHSAPKRPPLQFSRQNLQIRMLLFPVSCRNSMESRFHVKEL